MIRSETGFLLFFVPLLIDYYYPSLLMTTASVFPYTLADVRFYQSIFVPSFCLIKSVWESEIFHRKLRKAREAEEAAKLERNQRENAEPLVKRKKK